MSEKFSLKWNDYQLNWNRSLSELRNTYDLSDVTLISDDKVKFPAHKIILSACSNMFKFIFKDNTHANPLLYLGGVSSVHPGFILDYVYNGEVKLFPEQLDSFLQRVYPIKPQPKNTPSYLTSRVSPKNTHSIVPHEVNAILEIG